MSRLVTKVISTSQHPELKRSRHSTVVTLQPPRRMAGGPLGPCSAVVATLRAIRRLGMAGMSHARRSLRLLAVGVTVLVAVPAIALSSRANPAPGHASGRPSPVGIFTLGAGGWQVESSSVAAQDGSQV